jgi:hypothetical protein
LRSSAAHITKEKVNDQKITLALFLSVFAAGVAIAQNEQLPFTATGTATITSVTKLPGGLTQVNFNTSGTATHLGNFTGPLARIQDHQGIFGSTAVIVGANGKDSVFFSVSGRFETTKDKCVATSTGTRFANNCAEAGFTFTCEHLDR